MEFNINKIILEHIDVITGFIFLGYGFFIKMWMKMKDLERDIICIREKEIEAVKKFNDERYDKLEKKIDRMFDAVDELKKSINHMTGYMMGLKDQIHE